MSQSGFWPSRIRPNLKPAQSSWPNNNRRLVPPISLGQPHCRHRLLVHSHSPTLPSLSSAATSLLGRLSVRRLTSFLSPFVSLFFHSLSAVSTAAAASPGRPPSLFLLLLAPSFLRQSLSLTLPSVSLSVSIPVASSVSDPTLLFSILPSPLIVVHRPPNRGYSLINQILSPPPTTNNHRPSPSLDFTSFSTVNAAYSLSLGRRSTTVPTDRSPTSQSMTSDLIASSSLFVVRLMFFLNLSLFRSLSIYLSLAQTAPLKTPFHSRSHRLLLRSLSLG